MRKTFTLTILAENNSGVLHRVTTLFTRRRINIESLTAAITEERRLSRITVVADIEEYQIATVVRQIRRIIEVEQAFASENEDLISREVGLFKVSTGSAEQTTQIEEVAKKFGAVITPLEDNSIVLEKVGTESEIESLYQALNTYGVQDFARSGRVAIRRQIMPNEIGVPVDQNFDNEPHVLDAI